MITDQNGNKWFKGNLHTHTTMSDGQRTPEEVVDLYQRNEYDFLALTDHWAHSETIQNDAFLLLAGSEYDTGQTPREGIYHIVSIGAKEVPFPEKLPGLQAQRIIDRINECDGLAILAHPAWSMERPEEIQALTGLAGTEIYNSVSGPPWNCRAYSGTVLDLCAAGGCLLPLMAADDAHFYAGDECLSYIMVQAERLTRENILNSICHKRFYATQGPQFSYYLDEYGLLTVHTTPAQQVIFYTDTPYASDRCTTAASGQSITQAVYQRKPADSFVRFEIIDAHGRTGWSQYISFV